MFPASRPSRDWQLSLPFGGRTRTTSLPRLLGRPTTLVDANEVMWRFFAAHPYPAPE